MGADYSALRYEVTDISPVLAEAIRRYLDLAGLTFGAFDFLTDADSGATFFLECNSSGQWGWLAEACDLPIARAFAEELLGGH